MIADFIYILQWWAVLFVVGSIFLPTTLLLFKNSKDSFYIFSKVIGIGIISYLMLLFGTLHILSFNFFSLLFILSFCFTINIFIFRKNFSKKKIRIKKIVILEELLFLTVLICWSIVRSFEPSIHGLEKFMDYGFVNSILRSQYLPPKDMWLTPYSINYYFFGHLSTAVLTRLSGIPSNITYNLMIATLFAFTFTCGFSLLYNFLSNSKQRIAIFGGILGGALLSLSGNLHTIYAFFAAYKGDSPVPPWKLAFTPYNFPNAYWYPNATRFIPFTIHEFPLYSFVVSDLHGHVADIPFVLFTLALLYTALLEKKLSKIRGIFLALFLAVMYMTNVWDGAIYLLLTAAVVAAIHLPLLSYNSRAKGLLAKILSIRGSKSFFEKIIFQTGLVIILYVAFTLPFSIHFKPFVSGIGIVCAPKFLTSIGHLGPFLFEANHCQQSSFYQLSILYGFFAFFAISFFIFLVAPLFTKRKVQRKTTLARISFSLPKNMTHLYIVLFILLAVLLIIVPEFLYAKDIYPQHYRANTMFKLVYQSFMLLSLSSAYIIVELLGGIKKRILHKLFFLCTLVLLSLVFLYPYFAIRAYYGDFKIYTGLNGTAYLKTLRPEDLEAITFLNSAIYGQPVILEAQGDSYTDYARISSNTGLPTVLGWTVHEWLWRGTYDVPAPRIEDVKTMYEGDRKTTLPLLKKYHVQYVIVGPLEREKYSELNDQKFKDMGTVIFTSKNTQDSIYRLK